MFWVIKLLNFGKNKIDMENKNILEQANMIADVLNVLRT